MTKTLGVIPARMSSSRFPGKPLKNILKIPMIAHCFERAFMSGACDFLVIATPDNEIMDWASKFNIPSILTSDAHERATERAAEVVSILESNGEFFDYILLLQGDEPQINPIDINKLSNAFHDFHSEVVNLVYPIKEEDMADENVVKAILTNSSLINFFTRAHVPHGGKSGIRQLGMIGFSAKALKIYDQLEMTELEMLESIDMMRFIENDVTIQGVFSSSPILGVDRPEDIQQAELMMADDPLIQQYQSKYL